MQKEKLQFLSEVHQSFLRYIFCILFYICRGFNKNPSDNFGVFMANVSQLTNVWHQNGLILDRGCKGWPKFESKSSITPTAWKNKQFQRICHYSFWKMNFDTHMEKIRWLLRKDKIEGIWIEKKMKKCWQ